MEVSVVIPAFNEQEHIQNTVFQLNNYLKRNFSSYEIIIVNDGSVDKTGEIINTLDVTVIDNDKNFGKGYSVKRGINYAMGDYIFVTDADLPYSYTNIGTGVNLLKDFDMIFGYRERDMKLYPASRRFLSNIFFEFVNSALSLPNVDTQCGFKGFKNKKAKEVFSLVSINGFGFDIETVFLCYKLGMKCKNITVTINNHTKSNINFITDPIKMISNVMKIRSNDIKGKYLPKSKRTVY